MLFFLFPFPLKYDSCIENLYQNPKRTLVSNHEEIINPFSTDVQLMKKPGSWFVLAKCLKNTCGRVTFYVKMQVDDLDLSVKRHSSTSVVQTFY